MKSEFIQVAKFDFPFPAENYKTELIKSGIEFKEYQINESESTLSVFSVKRVDFEKAGLIKERVDIENSVSELKHKNKLAIKLAYFAIIAILVYTFYQVYSFIRGQL
jgi:hypothetical protein